MIKLTPHQDADPLVSITLSASHWIEILGDRSHYFALMDAFQPGGNHVAAKVMHEVTCKALEGQIRVAVINANKPKP